MKRDVAVGTNQRARFVVKRLVCFYHFMVKVFDYVVLDFRTGVTPFICRFRWSVFRSRLSASFFLYRNLISFLTRRICAFSLMDFAAGELLVNFMWAYLGITLLARHRLLK